MYPQIISGRQNFRLTLHSDLSPPLINYISLTNYSPVTNPFLIRTIKINTQLSPTKFFSNQIAKTSRPEPQNFFFWRDLDRRLSNHCDYLPHHEQLHHHHHNGTPNFTEAAHPSR